MTSVLDPREALDELTRPFAHEDVAASATPLVAVDLMGLAPDVRQQGDDERLISAVAAVPAVTVALVGPGFDGRLAPIAEAFDVLIGHPDTELGQVVVVDDPAAEVAALAEAVSTAPVAAITLVQLLRLGRSLSVRDALMAESLAYATLQTGDTFQSWLADRPSRLVTDGVGQPVLVEHRGSTLYVTLNRPERHNAFSAEMRDGLVDALRVAGADPSLDGILLSGAGPSFSAGGDLDEFGTVPNPATGHLVRSMRSPAWWMHQLRDRLRVHVHGACIGAGVELPAFASSVVADDSAYFGLPETGFGLVPGAGGTVSVTRRIGRHRTAWLALSGQRIDAHTALNWGLVDRIAAAG